MCIISAAAAGGAMAATMANVSIATTVAGAALSAYSTYQQGQAQAKQAEYQAAVQRNNQIIAERQANDAIQRGRIAEQQQRLKTAKVVSAQRAAMAANGLALSSGTPVDVIGDTAIMGELDALTIRANADREAYGYRVQGANAQAQAGLLSSQASSARSGAWIGGGSSLLSGAGRVADRWYKFTKRDE